VGRHTDRLAFAHQVHGSTVVDHGPGWRGILRVHDADGHLARTVGTAMAVTLADCVPVFIGHPSGAGAIVHSGWKGTAAGITRVAIDSLCEAGLPPAELIVLRARDLRVLLSQPRVFAHHRASGGSATPVDLRSGSGDARAAGVRDVTAGGASLSQ
jgi:hypothetical protein